MIALLSLRKILTYSLLLLYFTLSLGLTVNLHVCHGEIESVDFIASHTKKPCCTSESATPGCCKNLEVSFKKASEDERYQLASFFVVHPVIFHENVIPYVERKTFYVPKIIVANSHAPPPESLQPIIIKNCVYRI